MYMLYGDVFCYHFVTNVTCFGFRVPVLVYSFYACPGVARFGSVAGVVVVLRVGAAVRGRASYRFAL